jgi:hypothetical protein
MPLSQRRDPSAGVRELRVTKREFEPQYSHAVAGASCVCVHNRMLFVIACVVCVTDQVLSKDTSLTQYFIS